MDSQRRKRPWLAALLGTLATGLGHFYLRRWKRGLGWFLAAVVASLLFVPTESAQAFLTGEADLAALAPVLAIGVASVADAYVLARIRQREAADAAERESGIVGDAGDGTPLPGVDAVPTDATDGEACPHCGKELDPELDFCPWCTTRLSGDEAVD